MRAAAVCIALVLACTSESFIAGTRYIDPQAASSGDIGDKRVDLTEPSCDELRAMWRYTKRQSRAAKTTNGYSMYPPFYSNLWHGVAFPDRTKFSMGYRGEAFVSFSEAREIAPPSAESSPSHLSRVSRDARTKEKTSLAPTAPFANGNLFLPLFRRCRCPSATRIEQGIASSERVRDLAFAIVVASRASKFRRSTINDRWHRRPKGQVLVEVLSTSRSTRIDEASCLVSLPPFVSFPRTFLRSELAEYVENSRSLDSRWIADGSDARGWRGARMD